MTRGFLKLALTLALVSCTFACGKASGLNTLTANGLTVEPVSPSEQPRKPSAAPADRDSTGAGGFTLELRRAESATKNQIRIDLSNHDNDAVLDFEGNLEALIGEGTEWTPRTETLSFRDILPHDSQKKSATVNKPRRIENFHIPFPLHLSNWSYSGHSRRATGYVSLDAVIDADRRRGTLLVKHEVVRQDTERTFLSCEGELETQLRDSHGALATQVSPFLVRHVPSGQTARHDVRVDAPNRIQDVVLRFPLRCWYEI